MVALHAAQEAARSQVEVLQVLPDTEEEEIGDLPEERCDFIHFKLLVVVPFSLKESSQGEVSHAGGVIEHCQVESAFLLAGGDEGRSNDIRQVAPMTEGGQCTEFVANLVHLYTFPQLHHIPAFEGVFVGVESAPVS